MERVPGIEPGYSAWKAAALPLSYTRILPRYAKPEGDRQADFDCEGLHQSLFFANARPEADFRYCSKAKAFFSSEKAV